MKLIIATTTNIMKNTFLLFDGYGFLVGTNDEIVATLYKRFRVHGCSKPKTLVEYMKAQAKLEKRWSGQTLDTSSVDSFVQSLVKVGFLISFNCD